jgi:hypothetical protein
MGDRAPHNESLEKVRAHLAERLRSRGPEIEQAIYARVQDAVPDPTGSSEPAYQIGVRGAITAVLDYGLESIEQGPDWRGPIPLAAALQARRAARSGVSLGTVMRRYVAGHGELGEFVMSEAELCGVASNGPALHHIRRTQEVVLEHLTAAIEEEYERERERIAHSPEHHRAEIVQKLLGGAPADPLKVADLGYDVHAAWHLGMIATGAAAAEVLERLKAHFGRKLLSVSVGGMACAWLSGQKLLTGTDIERMSATGRGRLSLGIGEAGPGIEGWRLTHDQAQAAVGIALRKRERFARYSDDPLLAAALQNDTLARSLRQRYLVPLRSRPDSGSKLRTTLRVYIDLECNATSAAEILRVGRRAVTSRVCTAERLIGRPLRECLAELDLALRMEELDQVGASDDASPTQ